jgi:hypothetical protein
LGGHSLFKELPKARFQLGNVSRPALPHNQNFPADAPNQAHILAKSFHVSFAFVFPICPVCFGLDLPISATVHVPEAAVNKYYFPMSRKDNIRTPGQLAPVQAKSKPQPMNQFANHNFRHRILRTDARHAITALVPI